MGFSRFIFDSSLFIFHNCGFIVYVLVYHGDIIVIENTTSGVKLLFMVLLVDSLSKILGAFYTSWELR